MATKVVTTISKVQFSETYQYREDTITEHHEAMVIQQSEGYSYARKCHVSPQVLAIAQSENYAFQALEIATFMPRSCLSWDHGSYGQSPVHNPIYEGGAIIMVLHNDIQGFVAAGNLSSMIPEMSPQQILEVTYFLNAIWE